MTEVLQMKSASGQGLKMIKYDDATLPYLPDLDIVEVMRKAKGVPYREGDILVCSYPKCGAHWFTGMLWKMKTFDFSKRRLGFLLEFGIPDFFHADESPRIACTHLQPKHIPLNHVQNGGKIILLLRNPKDVVVSYYYHYKDSKVLANKQTFNEFFESYVTGVIPWGSYFDYLAAWGNFLQDKNAGRNNMQIEVFFYEDFKKDCLGNLQRLNNFLGLGRDRAYLERVIAETGIDSLREEVSRLSPHQASLDENGRLVIFRKGVIGDWKNHFTVTQSELIDRLSAQENSGGMFRFTYE